MWPHFQLLIIRLPLFLKKDLGFFFLPRMAFSGILFLYWYSDLIYRNKRMLWGIHLCSAGGQTPNISQFLLLFGPTSFDF